MQRIVIVVLLAIAASACSWPPRPSVPSPTQNAAQPVGEAASLPRLGVPEVPAVPRVSPPSVSVPRVSAGRGGLL